MSSGGGDRHTAGSEVEEAGKPCSSLGHVASFYPQDLRMVFTVLGGPCQGRGSACCQQLPILSRVSGSGFPTNPGGKLEVWGSFTCLTPHSALSLNHTQVNPSSPSPLFLL